MGLAYGGAIVRDGLVLALDAADRNSYPGTGTVWSDLSGNGNNGTLTNGPTFNSGNNGSIVFDGIDDRVAINTEETYSEYTVGFFCKWISSVGTQERLFGTNRSGTYTIRDPSNVNFHYNPVGGVPSSTSISSGFSVGFGNWCYISITVNDILSLVQIYINGTLRNTSTILPSVPLGSTIFLGAQNTGPTVRANCEFGKFEVYNRALTPHEVLQNYNATKTRFGL